MVDKPLGHEIHVLSNLICRVIDNSPMRAKIEDVTGNNTWIIAFIAQRTGVDVFQKDLENYFGITRSTASKVISLMVSKGLVERQSVPEDARMKKLVLTQRSWEILGQMDAEMQAVEEALVEGFTPEEVQNLYDYLDRIKENVSGIDFREMPLPEEGK